MNKNEVTEPYLVAQALSGDPASFGKLYEHYLDEIYQFIFYRVKGHQEAEDLSETVFFKAWQALDENPPREIPFRVWLYRIARNTVIDHYRTKRDQVDLEVAMQVPSFTDGPEAVVVRQEMVEELKDKLYQLNEDHQEVLTCRFVMGLSHTETAMVMSRSEQAVRALQYRAIVALRNLLTVEQSTAAAKPYLNGTGTLLEKKAQKLADLPPAHEESNHV
jgi:RNA polymerase sigma-70 factor (ECF subfamily)